MTSITTGTFRRLMLASAIGCVACQGGDPCPDGTLPNGECGETCISDANCSPDQYCSQAGTCIAEGAKCKADAECIASSGCRNDASAACQNGACTYANPPASCTRADTGGAGVCDITGACVAPGTGRCSPGTTQACGNCNLGARTCNSDNTWGDCVSGSACSPQATQACGTCGTGSQTCQSDCTWGACTGCPAACGGAVVEGNCWYSAPVNTSCTSFCASHGGVNTDAIINYAGSGGTDPNCSSVLNAIGAPFNSGTCANGPAVAHTCTPAYTGLGCFWGDYTTEPSMNGYCRGRCTNGITNPSCEPGPENHPACACNE